MTTGSEAGREEPTRPRRLSADRRRELVLDAGIHEFAEHGYQATRTADIAARAGISQPYIYALFPDKRALFLACHDRVVGLERDALAEAGSGTATGPAGEARWESARRLLRARPELVLFQLQAQAASTDGEIRRAVRERFMATVDWSAETTGRSREAVLEWIARALLANVALLLDLPESYRLEP
jgi:AcrR family transcriptional regulator